MAGIKAVRGGRCSVCLVGHAAQIHEATLRVRAWFREQVLLGEALATGEERAAGKPGTGLCLKKRDGVYLP